MPVNTTHKQYKAHSDEWVVMRDVVAGEQRVHERGEAYLPRLGGQDYDEYGAYVARAGFYNATQRTVDGLSGMVFRKQPVIELPTAMEEWSQDVTMDGISLSAFAEAMVEEQLIVSRAGMLVDFPPGGENATRAQAEQENRRPYLRMYQAETITGWQNGQVNNKAQLTQVRLKECVEVPSQEDPFDLAEVEQYRVLDLVTMDEDGNEIAPYYRQQVWQKTGTKWEVISETIPTMQGRPLTYIPFIFVGPRGTHWDVDKPVLLDLARTNLSHYRTVADLEHGAHFTALPTPYVFGVNDDHAPTAIGPTELWHGPNSDVTVGLLEYEGKGLESLEKRRESKEAHMASLGARMLAPEKRQAEAAETVALKHSGEMSVLASLANAVSGALTQAVEIARDWLGLSEDVSVELNRDFLPMSMDPAYIREMVKAVQGGQMSQEAFFYNLKKGEVMPPDRTFEEEQAALETDDAAGLMNVGQ